MVCMLLLVPPAKIGLEEVSKEEELKKGSERQAGRLASTGSAAILEGPMIDDGGAAEMLLPVLSSKGEGVNDGSSSSVARAFWLRASAARV